MAPMHVQNAREIPEYEIDPKELDFSNSVDITKVKLTCQLLYMAVQALFSSPPDIVVEGDGSDMLYYFRSWALDDIL